MAACPHYRVCMALVWLCFAAFTNVVLASDSGIVENDEVPVFRRDMTPEELKAAKEAFVTGFTGTTMGEVVLVVLVFPISLLVLRVVSTWLRHVSGTQLSTTPRFLLEFMIVVMPTIVAFTYAEYAPFIIIGSLVLCLVLELSLRRTSKGKPVLVFNPFSSSPHNKAKQAFVEMRLKQTAKETPHLAFVTNYRSGMILCTAIAILAVDFTVFPRRFVKCEVYGVSLMDAGVGSFVLASAFISRQARSVAAKSGGLRGILSTVKAVSPMLALGIARFMTVKGLSYQEHVSEYGVHWNFFFTMAVVAILSSVIEAGLGIVYGSKPAPTLVYVALSVIVGGGYQIGLQRGLKEYILTAPRVDWFSANREGFLGTLGFLSIYLAGVAIGRLIHGCQLAVPEWRKMLQRLTQVSVAALAASLALGMLVQPVSRRMTNLTYCAWILAYNGAQVMVLLAAELCFCGKYLPCESLIMQAVNKNGLAVFLLANVLTGLTNFSMQTIFQTNFTGFIVVTLYMFTVSAIATIVAQRQITLKVW